MVTANLTAVTIVSQLSPQFRGGMVTPKMSPNMQCPISQGIRYIQNLLLDRDFRHSENLLGNLTNQQLFSTAFNQCLAIFAHAHDKTLLIFVCRPALQSCSKMTLFVRKLKCLTCLYGVNGRHVYMERGFYFQHFNLFLQGTKSACRFMHLQSR